MMFYLSKILPLFVLPLGITLALVVAGLLRRRPVLAWAGVLLLWITSTPLVANQLMSVVETGGGRLPAAAPSAEAVVVLSSGRVTAPGPGRVSEWGDPDRFFAGVELIQLNKAPVLVFTGGWTPLDPEAPLEGDILKGVAESLGVPSSRIITTGAVVNTAAEAQAVKAKLLATAMPSRHVLLVTSAFHMPRAQALFEAVGFRVTPFPVDFSTAAGTSLSVLDVLPSAGALAKTQVALREIYGRIYYRAIQSW